MSLITRTFSKRILAAFAFILICIDSSPVMAKYWFFRARDKQKRDFVGVFDNNYGESCINIGGEIFKGIMPLDEADPYITNNPQSHFIGFMKVGSNIIKPAKKNIYFNITRGPGYLELNKWMKRSEINSLSCPDIQYFKGVLENGDNVLGVVIIDRGKLCLKIEDKLIIGKVSKKQLNSFFIGNIEGKVVFGNKVIKKGKIIVQDTETILAGKQESKISESFGSIYGKKEIGNYQSSSLITKKDADYLNQCLYY